MFINRIVNTYRYDAGVYTHTPKNIDGTCDIAYTAKGQHIICKKTLKWTFNADYKEMANFVADGVGGDSKRMDNNELYLYFSPEFYTIFAKRYYFEFVGSVDWRKPMSDRVYSGFNDTWTYKFGVDLTAKLFAKIDFSTDIYYIKRNGYVNNEFINH